MASHRWGGARALRKLTICPDPLCATSNSTPNDCHNMGLARPSPRSSEPPTIGSGRRGSLSSPPGPSTARCRRLRSPLPPSSSASPTQRPGPAPARTLPPRPRPRSAPWRTQDLVGSRRLRGADTGLPHRSNSGTTGHALTTRVNRSTVVKFTGRPERADDTVAGERLARPAAAAASTTPLDASAHHPMVFADRPTALEAVPLKHRYGGVVEERARDLPPDGVLRVAPLPSPVPLSPTSYRQPWLLRAPVGPHPR
jgi:hypothetical protein